MLSSSVKKVLGQNTNGALHVVGMLDAKIVLNCRDAPVFVTQAITRGACPKMRHAGYGVEITRWLQAIAQRKLRQIER